MKLCSNRPEGFGPHSNIHPSLPTTCFQDIIVTPLAAWIFLLLAFFVLLPLLFVGRKNNHLEPNGKETFAPTRTRKILSTTFRVLYYFLILALIAMISLEIARLVDAQLGIGLLPFLYPAILLAAIFRAVMDFKWMATSKTYRMVVKAANTLFWVMLIVVFSIKVAAYCYEGLHSRDDISPIDNYKVVDEVTDVGVMIGVVLVLAIMELFG